MSRSRDRPASAAIRPGAELQPLPLLLGACFAGQLRLVFDQRMQSLDSAGQLSAGLKTALSTRDVIAKRTVPPGLVVEHADRRARRG